MSTSNGLGGSFWDRIKGLPTWALILLALAYGIFPIDVCPDVIPGLGWLDDLGVIGWVIYEVVQRAKGKTAAGTGTAPTPTTVLDGASGGAAEAARAS